jgi:Ca2+-binding RTX toxin-like protein
MGALTSRNRWARLVAVIAVLAGTLVVLATPDAGAETIIGTPGPDLLDGNDGESDTIAGLQEDDVINGGDEVGSEGDGLFGGPGDDEVNGEGGDDLVLGGPGDDDLSGGDGDDYVLGGDGDDLLDGDDGEDLLIGDGGGCGSDVAVPVGATTAVELEPCVQGDDTLNGGGDDDILVGDAILCGLRERRIVPNGNDIVLPAADEHECIAGDDELNGGDGDDLLFGDELGLLRVLLCELRVERIELVQADQAPDSFIPEGCLLPGGDDTLNGDAGDDAVQGGGGDDTIHGGADDDILIGDFAILRLFFGEEDDGNDIETLLAALDEDELDELFFFLTEFQTPEDGNDTLFGDEGADILAGNGGHDILCGDADDIMLVGGPGTDVPCPVFTGLLDASAGPVDGDLSTDIRDLDDEFLESGGVDPISAGGTMEANPYEFVILVEPTKGTVTFDPITGEFTYTPNAGETGMDSFEYTLRRKVLMVDALPSDLVVDDDVLYLYSISQVVQFFLGDPPAVDDEAVSQNPPSVTGQPPSVTAQTTGSQLPVTGANSVGLAIVGVGLLMIGALAVLESQRRQAIAMRAQARHLLR